ncbi:GNAT superfamily N-acetyltransferase [Deinococcus metalli]|uniref:GNAT family acetyltransferase n=1 Tax=Deinococcus metalli TaxID=1141878 RepID=A0A7W8KFL0_9DEIO|nr:GNAT family N-acetyltransferase [Deinococcus metalli]MBB5376111.1 GNAT superfamily N-acetyltransferase [Deinococcus metalli]GHF40716.1 GNAT family acetyltransferase [Deinococcus metalli]
MSLSVESVSGPQLAPFLPALARLRIEVFREYPYLYDGSAAYEETYLRPLLDTPDALIVLARDGEEIVGASSALPLTQETEALRAPLHPPEFDPADILYLGESVLRAEYRGRGLGHAFFDHREAHARRLGLGTTAFCAVQRPEDHPARPHPYRTLHAFWAARGYVERPDLTTTLSWQDVGDHVETPKPMTYWIRAD